MRSGLRGISRNVFLLGLVSLFGDVSSEMVVPLLPAFLVALGGGAEALGIIEGAAEATASLFKYVSGRWADRARRLLPLAVAGYAIAGAVPPLLGGRGLPLHPGPPLGRAASPPRAGPRRPDRAAARARGLAPPGARDHFLAGGTSGGSARPPRLAGDRMGLVRDLLPRVRDRD